MAGAIKQGGGGRKGGGAPNAEPNVIPFIDIMLVLLIIFMVAAPPPTVDIKVDLPPPNAQNRPNQDDRPTFVSLEDENGELQYFVSGNSVQLDALPIALLNAARLNNPTMRGDDAKLFLEGKIFVDADQETQYFNVINLMNSIDQTGFKKVSLVAEEAQF